MVTPTSHAVPEPNFHCEGRLALAKFSDIFLPNIGEDQKKVLPSERGAARTLPYGKSGPGYYITFIKRLD